MERGDCHFRVQLPVPPQVTIGHHIYSQPPDFAWRFGAAGAARLAIPLSTHENLPGMRTGGERSDLSGRATQERHSGMPETNGRLHGLRCPIKTAELADVCDLGRRYTRPGPRHWIIACIAHPVLYCARSLRARSFCWASHCGTLLLRRHATTAARNDQA